MRHYNIPCASSLYAVSLWHTNWWLFSEKFLLSDRRTDCSGPTWEGKMNASLMLQRSINPSFKNWFLKLWGTDHGVFMQAGCTSDRLIRFSPVNFYSPRSNDCHLWQAQCQEKCKKRVEKRVSKNSAHWQWQLLSLTILFKIT